jgi:CRISPR/Cas system CSM-associated protein Csm4 (group 5 of RAMP superfamily)
MSVRAYRIIEIKMAENPSFNFLDNEELLQFIDEKTDFIYNLSSYTSGMVEIPVKILERALKMPKKLDIDENTAKRLQEDIEFAKSNNEEYVLYDCF